MAQQQGGAAGPAPIMAAGKAVPAGEGLRAYYRSKIEELEVQIRDKQHNLKRMEAQRNELNTQGEAGGQAGGARLAPTSAACMVNTPPAHSVSQYGNFGKSCSCCRSLAPM